MTQPQDTTTAYLYKLWPWIEANKNRLIGGGVIVIIAGFVISFYFWQQNQKEIAAGQALTELVASTPPDSNASQLADAYLKIAANFPGTRAGGRAAMQGAEALFEAGKYTEAQAQFEKYLETHPGDAFCAQAALGVAASLDAQGKTDLAASAYQRVISGFSDLNAVNVAKFALAQIDERQGRLADAENLYEYVAHNNPNGSSGSEAALRAMELKTRLQPASTSTASPSSFNLNTKP
ncbi:MAG: tetratricopeptide repeat protein [Verrucomicrobiota bacterium]|jgi:predicted negative regulator of RcsB-dependent stress response